VANTQTASLDLYAKVEDLLGIKEYAPKLYAHYLLFLQMHSSENLLDVGCGSGDFLSQMQKALEIPDVKGIDLSPLMVSKTTALGIDAEVSDLCELEGRYEVITAVFDMLNYLDTEALKRFMRCVAERLEVGGVFLCDINTLYGFENVAVGSFIVEDEKRFLTIDSDFEEGEYSAEFTLFEKEDTCYQKSQETIKQYYHSVESLTAYSGMSLLCDDAVSLYDFEDADKRFVVLQKV